MCSRLRVRTTCIAIALLSFLSPAVALAQSSLGAADGGSDDPAALWSEVQRDYAALSTEDCTSACKALASMRRATDRLCALDAGSRCTEARAKTQDAEQRVRAACPDCGGLAGAYPQPPAPVAATPAAAPRAEEVTAEHERGGCKSCATAPGDPSSALVTIAFGAIITARILRRRRRSGG